VHLAFPHEGIHPETEVLDGELMADLAEQWFDKKTVGSYGEQMAQVLAQAQFAYLHWFGSHRTQTKGGHDGKH
jgi:hypothetical protein